MMHGQKKIKLYERFGQNYAKSWRDSKQTLHEAGLQP